MNISENFEITFKEQEQQELFQQLNDEGKAFYMHLLLCAEGEIANIQSIYLFKDEEDIRAEIDTFSNLNLEMVITTNNSLSRASFWEMVDMIDTDEETLIWYNKEGRPDDCDLRTLLDDMEEWWMMLLRTHHSYKPNKDKYLDWLRDNNYIQ